MIYLFASEKIFFYLRIYCCNLFLLFLPHLKGQSRRIQVDVRSVQDSGTMPLISEIVLSVSVGCVEIQNTNAIQEGDEMDSYQVLLPSDNVPVRSFHGVFQSFTEWYLS